MRKTVEPVAIFVALTKSAKTVNALVAITTKEALAITKKQHALMA
jgi:hypothetical protein